MALDSARETLIRVLKVKAKGGVTSFTLDDLEVHRFKVGVSRAWMNNFMEELEHNGTATRMMSKSPAAWRFTDEFRKESRRIRLRKGEVSEQL